MKAAPLLYVLIALAIVGLYHGFKQDDAFITYQVARNFATGQGLVFNQGERYLSTSGPLYALLLGILGFWNTSAIPSISEALSCVSLIATSWGLFAWGQLWRRPVFGFLAGLFYLCIPTVTPGIGFEVLPEAALVVWAFYAYFAAEADSRPAFLSAVLLALAVLIRPDALIAAFALFAVTRVTKKIALVDHTFSVAVVLTFAGILALGAACLWIYFGHPLPGTMTAKIAQTQSGAWSSFRHGIWTQFAEHFPRWYPALLFLYGLFAIGVINTVRNSRPALLLAWPILHALAFSLVGLPDGPWYYIPEALGLAVGAGLGGQALIDLARKPGALKMGVSVALVSMSAFVTYRQVLAVQSDRESRERLTPQIQLYPQVATWLREHTRTTDHVGYYEVGLIGWLSNRRLVDPLGLVTPGQAHAVAQRDFDHAYREHPPEYLLTFRKQSPSGWASAYGLDPDGKEWFQRGYHHVARIAQQSTAVDIYASDSRP